MPVLRIKVQPSVSEELFLLAELPLVFGMEKFKLYLPCLSKRCLTFFVHTEKQWKDKTFHQMTSCQISSWNMESWDANIITDRTQRSLIRIYKYISCEIQTGTDRLGAYFKPKGQRHFKNNSLVIYHDHHFSQEVMFTPSLRQSTSLPGICQKASVICFIKLNGVVIHTLLRFRGGVFSSNPIPYTGYQDVKLNSTRYLSESMCS